VHAADTLHLPPTGARYAHSIEVSRRMRLDAAAAQRIGTLMT